ncbi:MAG: serine/threonine-protein kinase [Acidobacteriota bacterium]
MTSPSGESGAHLPAAIGRYRILERIGRGAMGIVYAALDEPLDRRVALKLMLAELDEDPAIRERFYREARITGQLAHRNIVTVFDLGEEQGRPYLVMELLEGLPLAGFLRTPEGQSLDARLDLMIQVCDGLQYAHQAGVIHRDIKPSNLFVQRDGKLKILDFGVARLAKSSLTGSGFLVGTPEYMAPEQPLGQPVDARSDVYSAACVFYFMLAGRSPFGSRDLLQMMDAMLNEAPPALPDSVAPDSVRRILMRGLTKAPGDRYQQCAEMGLDLDRARRNLHGAAYRVVQAAHDRFHAILVLIEDRRRLGRSLGMPNIDESCDTDARRLRRRFPMLAAAEDSASRIEPMDPAVAQAALETLQSRHNAELAALAAMREQRAAARARAAADNEVQSSAPRLGASSWKSRAAAIWRKLPTDQ